MKPNLELDPTFVERMKMSVDISKQFMTLSSGAIVIGTTFLGKNVAVPIHVGLLMSSIGALVLSLVTATLNLVMTVIHTTPIDMKNTASWAGHSFLVAAITFGIGIILMGWFAAVNI